MVDITVVKPLEDVASGNVQTVTLAAATGIPYRQGARQVLVIENSGATPAALLIKGALAGVIPIQGVGSTVDLAAGFELAVAANQTVTLALVNISEYLKGAVTITGGTADHHAYIIEM